MAENRTTPPLAEIMERFAVAISEMARLEGSEPLSVSVMRRPIRSNPALATVKDPAP